MRVLALFAVALIFCGVLEAQTTSPEPLVVAPDVAARLAKFARVELAADLSPLSAGDRAVLAELIRGAREMDEIFLRQVSSGNADMRDRLKALTGPLAEPARAYFRLNMGPWDCLRDNEPFIGKQAKPLGAGYYPEDLTKAEFERWQKAYPERAESLSSFLTVVRRDSANRLQAVGYAEAYKPWLTTSAEHLRKAAALATNASLKNFLELRASAFLSDDYYNSDLAWMDLDAPVEVTIGPYETYEDALFGYKAAYEAFVTVALPKESADLERYKKQLPFLERNLPIPDEHKNLKRGTESPIRVVDVVFASGEASQGIQTTAYNLPNDERVREAKGSKKVLLRNVMRAKFEQILVPIAGQVLSKDDAAKVSFPAFFSETLHHELSHGLGPGRIRKGDLLTEVRVQLKELFSAVEEAKADVMGVYNILALVEKGEMPRSLLASLEPTYVAGLFRSARFGTNDAHGEGVVAQFNYLSAKGAITSDGKGHYRAVADKFGAGIRDLVHDILMLQANGDYDGTKAFLEKFGKPSEEMKTALERLKALPVDIRPVYKQAEELAK